MQITHLLLTNPKGLKLSLWEDSYRYFRAVSKVFLSKTLCWKLKKILFMCSSVYLINCQQGAKIGMDHSWTIFAFFFKKPLAEMEYSIYK